MSKKRKKRHRRYTMNSNQEKQLANFIYGVVSFLNNNHVEPFASIDSNEKKIIVNEDEAINTSVSTRLRIIHLIFAIELLLKYHILQQAGNQIFEIISGENGHDLFVLYRKLNSDFKEKLKSSYNEHLDEFNIENMNRITNVEELIDQNKNMLNRLRYSFFTEIDHNSKQKKGEELTVNISCLPALFNALYALSDLLGKKGLSKDNVKILGSKTLSLPL